MRKDLFNSCPFTSAVVKCCNFVLVCATTLCLIHSSQTNIFSLLFQVNIHHLGKSESLFSFKLPLAISCVVLPFEDPLISPPRNISTIRLICKLAANLCIAPLTSHGLF